MTVSTSGNSGIGRVPSSFIHRTRPRERHAIPMTPPIAYIPLHPAAGRLSLR
ncbi:hypothetical protein SM11_chr3844 [Sinorhizobium meliloti SM11]|uniref:Uncharacterized protein n=1 Tax=Sinorhizobium meliloti (strain SM11) TaxID=707241 RepID=F7X5A6_SINMM|nr:hypothetical protein SM11_chr3844 [Sinorhizobium meliloti SM11]